MVIKVAHIITRLDLGGAQQNTLYTVSHLDASRFKALLICGPGGILDGEAPAPIFVPDLVREIRPWKDLRAFFDLYKILQRERPQVVHTHSSKAGILGRLAARCAGVPVIIHTFHGFGFHGRQRWWIRWPYVFAEKLCAKFSSALIFVSRANQEEAARLGLGETRRHALIRSGIKLADFQARTDASLKKKELGLAPETPLILSVGNLKPQKNPQDFLSAARIVSQQRPDAAFVFVGEGPLRPKIESAASGLPCRFLLPGWRRDVPELLAACDIFVLTSLWEGLPRALVEAMKSGKPCVCYATDGVRDIVCDGENGFLVPAGDAPALARKILDLLSDADRRREMGKAAAASISQEFDIDLMVQRQEEVYQHLIKYGKYEKA